MTKSQRWVWVLIFLAIGLVALIILVPVLGLVFFLTFSRDTDLVAESHRKIDRAMNLLQVETDDGNGIGRDRVKQEIGQEPSDVSQDGPYMVETYTFDRLIPFASKPYLTVVYNDGRLQKMLENAPYKRAKYTENFVPNPEKIDESRLPAAAVAGPPVPGNDDP